MHAIDTLKIAHSLERAGFSKEQSEGLATTFADSSANVREDLVTKDFLKAEMAELRGTLRSEIAGAKNDTIRWLLGSQVLLVMILVALANFTKAFG